MRSSSQAGWPTSSFRSLGNNTVPHTQFFSTITILSFHRHEFIHRASCDELLWFNRPNLSNFECRTHTRRLPIVIHGEKLPYSYADWHAAPFKEYTRAPDPLTQQVISYHKRLVSQACATILLCVRCISYDRSSCLRGGSQQVLGKLYIARSFHDQIWDSGPGPHKQTSSPRPTFVERGGAGNFHVRCVHSSCPQ
ncbi:hypothetical protein M404DRAFT_479275 [Pisolithus tinctorius Marx 270]|uniref:Uncharacterized protein n=1 Tax=Pisolithus tinctorius Marx 270 TaxID=870435 RepID=A0A0C3JBC2_PISTI|nr:hypothetical protein M404DRAFT_479275 [Pisolithus tinctorius Marx 270]